MFERVLIAALLLLGVALRLMHLPVDLRTPDERTYLRYATVTSERGLAALPTLTRDYVADPKAQILPPPSRFGFILPAAVVVQMAGAGDPAPIAAVSCIASILLLLVFARIGIEHLGVWPTLLGLAFLVASPLDLALARRAWADELLSLVALTTLYAVLRDAGGGGLRWSVLALVLGASAVWVKEAGALVLAFAILSLVWTRRHDPRRAFEAAGLGVVAGAVALGGLAMAAGGFGPLLSVFSAMANAAQTNEYVLRFQTGGFAYYPAGLAVLQPAPMVMGVVAGILAFATPGLFESDAKPRASKALRWLAIFAAVIILAAMLYPQKNLRFIASAYALLHLLAGSLLAAIPGALRARSRIASAATAIAVAAFTLFSMLADHTRFEQHFIRDRIPDLATPWFVHPWP